MQGKSSPLSPARKYCFMYASSACWLFSSKLRREPTPPDPRPHLRRPCSACSNHVTQNFPTLINNTTLYRIDRPDARLSDGAHGARPCALVFHRCGFLAHRSDAHHPSIISHSLDHAPVRPGLCFSFRNQRVPLGRAGSEPRAARSAVIYARTLAGASGGNGRTPLLDLQPGL